MTHSAMVFTISDSSHAGIRRDVSGPAVRARLEELGWAVESELMPDDAAWISRRLAEVADSGGAAAIFTTGGTGVALRDVTQKHGGQHFASAVGEVNVVDMMKANEASIGGEGNGGIIFPELHYGRDALVGIALFLSHLARSGKSAQPGKPSRGTCR